MLRFLLLASAFLLAGCGATLRGEPEQSLEPGRDVGKQIIDHRLDPKTVDALLRKGIGTTERDQIVYARMAEIDRLYNVYELEISRELRSSSLLVALVGIGVGSAGALAGERLSQLLSAGSAALAGGQKAFETEVLVDRTIQAFQSQMRAERAKVRSQILLKLTAPIRNYPMEAALSDLASYRQAGTLTAALLAISESATTSEGAAQQQLKDTEKSVIKFAYGENDFTSLLNDYVFATGITPDEQRRRLALIDGYVKSRKATKSTDCTLDTDVLLNSTDNPDCVALQREVVERLRADKELTDG